jgi:hypothetical protein
MSLGSDIFRALLCANDCNFVFTLFLLSELLNLNICILLSLLQPCVFDQRPHYPAL